MKDHQEIRKELESISPFLAELEKKQPFEVPPAYFKQMQNEVLQQLKADSRAQQQPAGRDSWLDTIVSSLQLLLQPRYALRYATVAILIVAGILIFRSLPAESDPETGSLAGLSLQETQEYIARNIDEFETAWLMDLVSETDFPAEGRLDSEEELDLYLEEIIDDLDESEIEELL